MRVRLKGNKQCDRCKYFEELVKRAEYTYSRISNYKTESSSRIQNCLFLRHEEDKKPHTTYARKDN